MNLPSAVSVREVGPRDGLQNEPPVPTAAKVELVDALSSTGLRRIEAVSFVHPRAIPQMADADEVWAGIRRRPDVRWSALVPNLRGAERALAAGFDELEVVVSASDTHNRRNLSRSTEESMDDITAVVERAHARGGAGAGGGPGAEDGSEAGDGLGTGCGAGRAERSGGDSSGGGATVEVIVATAFGCPYEGDVPVERVVSLVDRALGAGADRIAFGDTTGMGTPTRVTAVVGAVRQRHPDVPLLLHFHDTRGTALANVLAALQLGVTDFDASVGGLGGCPYAPGAAGNLATEELVHMLDDMGIDTGVDLEVLLEAARLAERVVGRRLESGVLRAGPRSRLTPLPT